MSDTAAAKLVLASASPRRRQLLEVLGLDFEVRPAEIDETPLEGESPDAYVIRLAREKSRAVASNSETVIAADTTVVLEGEILGKPRDRWESAQMISRLAGSRHDVLTGVAVCRSTSEGALEQAADLARTTVQFAALSPEEVAWYVATGEGDDKAGAYGIQGIGALFVEGIEGNYGNVMGLPAPLLLRLCREVGVDLLSLCESA